MKKSQFYKGCFLNLKVLPLSYKLKDILCGQLEDSKFFQYLCLLIFPNIFNENNLHQLIL